MPKQKSDVYVVHRAFVVDGRRVMRRGTRIRVDDPRVKGNERNLILADDGLEGDVEQATAAPGERRNLPTKAEMLKEAKEAGVDVPKNATKAEIAEAIEEAE